MILFDLCSTVAPALNKQLTRAKEANGDFTASNNAEEKKGPEKMKKSVRKLRKKGKKSEETMKRGDGDEELRRK